MVRTNKNNVALAGEFAVLSRLALYNYDANMTLGRTKGVDILVSNPRNHKMYRLEVKTKLRRHDNEQNNSTIFGRYFAGWMMHKKHETNTDRLLFYCFVIILEKTHQTRFFVVPSKVVARYVKNQHLIFERNKKKSEKGELNEIRTMRIGFDGETYPLSTPTIKQYEDNWSFCY